MIDSALNDLNRKSQKFCLQNLYSISNVIKEFLINIMKSLPMFASGKQHLISYSTQNKISHQIYRQYHKISFSQ